MDELKIYLQFVSGNELQILCKPDDNIWSLKKRAQIKDNSLRAVLLVFFGEDGDILEDHEICKNCGLKSGTVIRVVEKCTNILWLMKYWEQSWTLYKEIKKKVAARSSRDAVLEEEIIALQKKKNAYDRDLRNKLNDKETMKQIEIEKAEQKNKHIKICKEYEKAKETLMLRQSEKRLDMADPAKRAYANADLKKQISERRLRLVSNNDFSWLRDPQKWFYAAHDGDQRLLLSYTYKNNFDMNQKCAEPLFASRHPSNHTTAIMMALNSGNSETVRMLLSLGCTLGNPDRCLDLACRQPRGTCIRIALEARADIDHRRGERPGQGLTNLMQACSTGYTDVVNILIEAKASIDLQNVDGKTALMCCVTYRGIQTSCVEILIKAGARKDIKDNKGKTYLDSPGLQLRNGSTLSNGYGIGFPDKPRRSAAPKAPKAAPDRKG